MGVSVCVSVVLRVSTFMKKDVVLFIGVYLATPFDISTSSRLNGSFLPGTQSVFSLIIACPMVLMKHKID